MLDTPSDAEDSLLAKSEAPLDSLSDSLSAPLLPSLGDYDAFLLGADGIPIQGRTAPSLQSNPIRTFLAGELVQVLQHGHDSLHMMIDHSDCQYAGSAWYQVQTLADTHKVWVQRYTLFEIEYTASQLLQQAGWNCIIVWGRLPFAPAELNPKRPEACADLLAMSFYQRGESVVRPLTDPYNILDQGRGNLFSIPSGSTLAQEDILPENDHQLRYELSIHTDQTSRTETIYVERISGNYWQVTDFEPLSEMEEGDS